MEWTPGKELLRLLKILGVIVLSLLLFTGLAWSISAATYINWTGFGDYTTPTGEYIRGRTLWDWIQLLLIPVSLIFIAFSLNRSHKSSERQRAKEQTTLQQKIAVNQQQETALQAYFDRMSELLLQEKLRTSRNQEVRNVARTRTLTVLRNLDPDRKKLVLLFLRDSGLISTNTIVDLSNADFRGIALYDEDLREVNLSGAFLNNSILYNCNFERTNLRGADLSEADLGKSQFAAADLTRAYLEEAKLRDAFLADTNLSFAMLYKADLRDVYLMGVNFTGATLSQALVTENQLTMARTLEDAILPDGTKHVTVARSPRRRRKENK